MKHSYLRAGLAALACVAGLSACGGGNSGQLLLGGMIYNVTKDGLILQNNGAHDYAPTAAALASSGGQFYFPDLISIDEAYDVTVKQVPSNVVQCTVSGGKGRTAFNVSSVAVICELKTHKVGGTITGLGNASGLVLINGKDRQPIDPGATTFTMPAGVGEEVPYGVTVLTQPAGRACTVANGTNTMGTADVTNIAVNCVPAQP
jgi:hypothetical protein